MRDLPADLNGAPLSGADLTGASLAGRDLGGADLRSARLLLADLEGASLRGADLSGADLRGANLCGADLRGANLAGARLEGALAIGAVADLLLPAWKPAADPPGQAWRAAARPLLALLGRVADADEDEVLDTLDTIALRLPEWGFAWAHLGRALRAAGRDEVASDVLITAMALDPGGPARHVFARLLLDRGDLENARPAFERLRADKPDDPQVSAELGYVLGRLGELPEARRCLELAVAGGVVGPNTWSALGMVAWSQGDLDAAGRAFTEAVQRSAGAPEHALSLSRFYQATGDLAAAFDALRPAAADPSLRVELADLASRMGDLDAAIELFRSVPRTDAGAEAAQLGLADALLRKGAVRDARLAMQGLQGPVASELLARIEARERGLPAPPPRVLETAPPPPAPVPLPLSHAELGRVRAAVPSVGPFVEHVFFASPHAIGHVLPAGDEVVVAFRGPGALGELGPSPTRPAGEGIGVCLVPGPLAPVSCEVARSVLLAEAGRGEAPGAPPLFDGRGIGQELQQVAEVWPLALRRRLDALEPVLEQRFGVSTVAGEARALDAFVPDVVLMTSAGPRLWVPPGAVRRGSRLWEPAQAFAWLGVDREVFLRSGALVPTADARALLRALGAEAQAPQLVGLGYLVWLRWFLGLASLWPARRRTFAQRAVAVLDEIGEARLLAVV